MENSQKNNVFLKIIEERNDSNKLNNYYERYS